MELDLDQLTVPDIRDHLRRRALAAIGAMGVETDFEPELAPPPDPAMGELGFPCFVLARALRKAPPLIAEQLARQIEPDALIARVGTDKAYVNFQLRPQALIRVVLGQILREGERYGSGLAHPARHWMVEYSAPNTNKPLHLGHLRNNLLGASLARILAFHGHRVTRINLVNDRGVHICKSMLAYQRWGDGAEPEHTGKKGDHLVGQFYVLFEARFAEEYEGWQQTDAARQKLQRWLGTKAGRAALEAQDRDPGAPGPQVVFFKAFRDEYFNNESPLGAQVRQMLLDWEEGDPEVRSLWQRMNRWVMDGFDRSYSRMGVGFDHVQLESETYKLGKSLVQEGLEQGVLTRLSDGAVVCDLSQVGLRGDKVLLRSDGTSVYMTQDLGTAAERFERFDIDRLVYVVGDEQIYHFDVLFRVLGLLRPGLSEACYHLAYGMIRLPEGRMKSREGTVVDADDLMDEMHRLAREETLSRAEDGKAHTADLSQEELEHRAEGVGMAALKYFLLKFTPRKSFEYDPKESIDFLGQTGPYCLFNYARTRSLLRRAGGGVPLPHPAAPRPGREGVPQTHPGAPRQGREDRHAHPAPQGREERDPELQLETLARLGTDRELELVRLLAAFPEVVTRAAGGLDPSRVAEYLFDLCKSFAFIFTDKVNHPIVTCEDQELRRARLMLVTAIGHTLRAGLGLLGIEVLEEM